MQVFNFISSLITNCVNKIGLAGKYGNVRQSFCTLCIWFLDDKYGRRKNKATVFAIVF